MTGLMREMTGLEKLRELAEAIKQDADNRRIELCSSLGIDLETGWADAMAAMRRRLMPEGMEWLIESWPRFDANEPLRWDDEYVNGNGGVSPLRHVSLYADGRAMLGKGKVKVVLAPGERVKRPERKDSRPDGCCHPGSYECDELAFRDQNSGEDVYADKCLVPELRRLRESGIRTLGSCCGHGTTRPNIVVAPECEGAMRRQGYEGRRNKFGVLEFAAKSSCPERKVLDADGVEIRVGDTVCGTRDMEPMRVVDTDSRECGFKHIKCEKEGDGFWFYCAGGISFDFWTFPNKLTHERPDSWERLEEDADKNPFDYCKDVGHRLDTCENSEAYKARDLVRRCRALAERERGGR